MMKRYQAAILAVVTTVALAFSACTFQPPAAVTAAGPTGTVSLRLTPVSPAVYTAFKVPASSAAAKGPKAFLGMDRVYFQLYLNGELVESWTENPSASAITGTGTIPVTIQDHAVSIGSGYVLKASVYNDYTSSTIPMVVGASASFDVTAGATTPVSIVCVPPYDGTSSYLTMDLVANTATSQMQLATPWVWDYTNSVVTVRGSEQWFRAVPSTYWTAFTAVPDVSMSSQAYPVVCVYDASGNFLGSGSPVDGYNGNPASAVVGTVPGNTYWFGVVDFSQDTMANRNLAVSYGQAPPPEEAVGSFDIWQTKTLLQYQPKLFYFDVDPADTVLIYWDDAYSGGGWSGNYSYELGGTDIQVTGYLSDKTTTLFVDVDYAWYSAMSYTNMSTTIERIWLFVEGYGGGTTTAGNFGLLIDYQDYVASNNAPGEFYRNTPYQGADVWEYPIQFSWTAAADPDYDAVTYDVYCGTNYPPTTKVGTTSSTYFAIEGGLPTHYTIYYWNIVASDGKGGSTTISDYPNCYFYKSFGNSAPDTPVLVSPIDYATVSRQPVLTWTCTDPDGDALTYTITLNGNQLATGFSGTSFPILTPLTAYTTNFWQVYATDPSLTSSTNVGGYFYTNNSLEHYLANFNFRNPEWTNTAETYVDAEKWYTYVNIQGGDYVPNWTFDVVDPNLLWNGPIDIQMRTAELGALDPNVVYMADTNNNGNGYAMSMFQDLPDTMYAYVTENTKLSLRFKIISYAGGSFYPSYYEAPVKVYVKMYGSWMLLTGYTIYPASAVAPGEVVAQDAWIERDITLNGLNTLYGYGIGIGTAIQGIKLECNGWAWQVLVDTIDLHE